jgi:hypothetical protein
VIIDDDLQIQSMNPCLIKAVLNKQCSQSSQILFPIILRGWMNPFYIFTYLEFFKIRIRNCIDKSSMTILRDVKDFIHTLLLRSMKLKTEKCEYDSKRLSMYSFTNILHTPVDLVIWSSVFISCLFWYYSVMFSNSVEKIPFSYFSKLNPIMFTFKARIYSLFTRL